MASVRSASPIPTSTARRGRKRFGGRAVAANAKGCQHDRGGGQASRSSSQLALGVIMLLAARFQEGGDLMPISDPHMLDRIVYWLNSYQEGLERLRKPEEAMKIREAMHILAKHRIEKYGDPG